MAILVAPVTFLFCKVVEQVANHMRCVIVTSLCWGFGLLLLSAGLGFGLLLLSAGLMYSGIYDVSARHPDNKIVAWVLHKVYTESLHHHAHAPAPPGDYLSAENVSAGARLYDSTCVAGHGAPDKGPGPIGLGINPPAPFLLASKRRNNFASTYWVMQNGVKMTAMPSFSKSLTDTQIWQIAAFLYTKKGLSPAEYKQLVAP